MVSVPNFLNWSGRGSASSRAGVQPAARPMAGSGPYGDSGYEIAQTFSRFHKEILHGAVDSEDKELTWSARKRMLVQSYQMARLYPYSYVSCIRLADHVIGPGVWPKFLTSDEEWNVIAAKKFKAHFDDPRLCDVRNRQNLTGLLRHLVPHVTLFAGDAGLHILPGMWFNPYESDRIGPPDGKPNPPDEIMGVKVAPWGEFLAFRKGTRTGSGVKESELIDAKDMYFIARHLLHRFDQVRGVPAIAQAFARLVYAGEITTAELRAMQAASKIAWYQPVEGIEEFEIPKDTDGNPIYPRFQMKDGMVLYGPEGHDPKMFSYNRPGDNFEAAMRMTWTETAAVLGMSYPMLTGDYNKTQFSTIRGVRMEDSAGFRNIQDNMVKPILDRLAYHATSLWVKRGELPPAPPDFEGDAGNYLVSWSFPKLEHIDPYKEEQKNRLSLENGGTLRDIHGDNWAGKLEEKANEMATLKRIAKKYSTGGIEVDPEELLRPISKERTQAVGAGAEQIRDGNGEPTQTEE